MKLKKPAPSDESCRLFCIFAIVGYMHITLSPGAAPRTGGDICYPAYPHPDELHPD